MARKAAALRRFYAFLHEEGLRADDPSSVLPRPGQRRALPKILSHADIDRLFAAIAERTGAAHPSANDLRLAALVELLYGSGLRASELVALPRNAVHPDRPFLILKGKGGVERMVPISDQARAAVAAWRVHVPADKPWLFPGGKKHLTRIRLYQLIKALAAEAGIPPDRVSPHVLRHAFATHLLAAGPICARCRRCWAMPTSPRPKSTPMSRRADWSNSSMRNTRSLIFGTSALRR